MCFILFLFYFIFYFFYWVAISAITAIAVPPIMLHNLSLRTILYDAVLHLGNKFDLI